MPSYVIGESNTGQQNIQRLNEVLGQALARGATPEEAQQIVAEINRRGDDAALRFIQGTEPNIRSGIVPEKKKTTKKKEISVGGGIEHRQLEFDVAKEAASQEYLRSRLDFETKDASRGRALQAADQALRKFEFDRRFGLDVTKFATSLTGPSNYGLYANILSGLSPTDRNAPLIAPRIGAALGLTSGRVAGTPRVDPEAIRGGSYEQLLRRMFTPVEGGALEAASAQAVGGRASAVPTIDPGALNLQNFFNLLPSEREGALSLASTQGYNRSDFAELINRSIPGAVGLSPARFGAAALKI